MINSEMLGKGERIMTTVYRVVTKHTKQVLKDFIRFTYKVNYPKSTFRLCVIAAGFFILALFLQHQPLAMGFSIVIGFAVFVFTFTRHLIAFSKLTKQDENYQNQTEIEFTFGQSEFIICRLETENHIKYGEISNVYQDKRNYYLLINKEDLQVIPRSDFAFGNSSEFERFISHKIGKEVNDLYIPFKERMKRMNESRKQAEEMHDEKIEMKKQQKTETRKEKER